GGITENVVTTRYITDNANRILAEETTYTNGTETVSYKYDPAGRVIEKARTGMNGYSKETYEYDGRDHQTKYWYTKGGKTTLTEYTYDVEDNRTAKRGAVGTIALKEGKTQASIFTEMSMTEDQTIYTYDDERNIIAENKDYYISRQGMNLYEAKITLTVKAAYIKDASGTVRGEYYDHALIDNGVTFTTTEVEFTAYGKPIDNKQFDGIGFTGHFYDRESGLYYARARYYDPEAGRFTSHDAKPSNGAAGQNLYNYTENRPYYYADYDGNETYDFFLFKFGWDDTTGNFFIGYNAIFYQESFQLGDGKVSSYEHAVGIDLYFFKWVTGENSMKGHFDEVGLNLSAQIYIFNFGFSYSDRTYTQTGERIINWNASAGIGVGGFSAGINFGQRYKRNNYDSAMRTVETHGGLSIGIKDVGIRIGMSVGEEGTGTTIGLSYNQGNVNIGANLHISADGKMGWSATVSGSFYKNGFVNMGVNMTMSPDSRYNSGGIYVTVDVGGIMDHMADAEAG
ncbi:MAG: RHS repeat-associated core domain-containing protein, partial [Sedimentisphaerales bacterium]|nr:RHS repeat-associated core domain-containing protein [Sedimentisphaerales bacterium]